MIETMSDFLPALVGDAARIRAQAIVNGMRDPVVVICDRRDDLGRAVDATLGALRGFPPSDDADATMVAVAPTTADGLLDRHPTTGPRPSSWTPPPGFGWAVVVGAGTVRAVPFPAESPQ